ncbi:MAG: hypothetical protein L6Q77_08105 [Bacteroidetes bacterium]|nr:hypothetical protein [Bacteroidota bacterium]
MSLDVSNNIFKTKLKNTILKKGFQGSNPKPEQIARFRWLNYDSSRTFKTPEDLFSFVREHGYAHLLPSDDAFLPDLVSALHGEIVFISEYPGIAKQFETVFDGFYRDFVQKGLVYEYPVVQSTNVLISREEFRKWISIKRTAEPSDQHETFLLNLIGTHPKIAKKDIREACRPVPFLFQRLDFYLYKLTHDLRIYKTGFDAIGGNLYELFERVVPPEVAEPLPDVRLEDILDGMIAAALYINPVLLQRSLKKHFTREAVTAALDRLIGSDKVYKARIEKETVLVSRRALAANS